MARRGQTVRMALLFAMLLLAAASRARAGSEDYEWQQHPGAVLPLDITVRDETGKAVTLGHLFHGVPVILDLGYFNCPSLCGIIRSNLYDSLDKTGLRAGRDFELASLSIDAQEQPTDAAAAKARDLATWPDLDGAGLHYLTASRDAIDAVAAAVGFRSKYDERYKQFLHPTGLVLVTGAGSVSSYLLGAGYPSGDLRTGLIRARSGGIARAALPILLLCFHYDETTGRYTLVIMKLLRLMGALTIVTIAGTFLVLSRHRAAG